MGLSGIFPAMVTPFNENGAVDTRGLKSHANFLLDAGVHGLHPCGTTGEVTLLTSDERRLVAETVLDAAGGRAPVIVQVGHMFPSEAAALAKHAVAAGAAAISVVTPYYYSLPERALLAYFEEVVAAVPEEFPVYLYNIPQCTNNPVRPNVLATLMEAHGNVVGAKHSMSDIEWLAEYLAATDGKAQLFVGSDKVALQGLATGAVGVVSGNANAFPELFVEVYSSVRSGDLTAARTAQERITVIADLLGNGGSLASFKAVAKARGVEMDTRVRAPLPQLDEAEEAKVKRALALQEGWR